MIKFLLFKHKVFPLCLFLLLFLSISSCEKESLIEQNETRQATEQFFQYRGNVSIIKSAVELLTQRNDSSEFISRIIDKYGYPLWNHTAYIHEEDINRTSLFVPFKSDKSDEVETIWVFRFYPNEHRYIYRGATRKNSAEEDEWTFDYFTQQVFKKRSKSGIIFKHSGENDSGNKTRYIVYESANMTIECVDSYAGPEGYEVYKGTYCWVTAYGGGSGASGGGSGGASGDGHGGGGGSGSGSGSNPGSGGGTGIGHEGVEPDLDGGGTYTPPPVPSTKVLMITKNIDLNSTQVSKLNIALNDFINEGCMQKALYDALVDKNVQLDFGMLPTAVDPANYNPNNKSVKFRENSAITGENLKEELFHAWQDAYYPGGTAQYGKDAQGNKLPGLVNVEFEAKFYRDIIGHPDGLCCNAFGENLPNNLYQEYYDWIESIRFSGSLSFSNSDYGKWLNYFQQYDKNYTSPMSDNLSTPKALRDIISNATCF